MEPVRIIATGGTLDKVHDWLNEAIGFPKDGAGAVGDILAEARCAWPAVEQILQKDSLELTEADRALIAEAVARAPETRIVITHGTSTMGETARYLAARKFVKTVVLTGAMRPFSLQRSDAGFNLGAALMAAQLASSGVYGAMNGRLFEAAALHKNLAAGRFDM